MSTEQRWQLLNLGQMFLVLVIPAIVMSMMVQRWPARPRLAVFISTLFTHILSYTIHMMWLHPLALRRAAERGDTDYDGVGGNAALLLFGWWPPLTICLLFAWWARRRKGLTSQLC